MNSSKRKYDEEELIFSLKARDKQALEYLYDHYSKSLYCLILSIIKDREISNDILQETFIKIWKSIDAYYSEKGRLFTWIAKIARNTALDKIRSKEFTQRKNTESLINGNNFEPSIPDSVSDVGLKKTILRLKDEHRQLIDLSYFHGFTHEELSKALDMPLGTVKSRLYLALRQLKSLLSQ
ncbi:MAG: sigma-70 family RNA polymerase sigma factor [Flavisolibacter sp.]